MRVYPYPVHCSPGLDNMRYRICPQLDNGSHPLLGGVNKLEMREVVSTFLVQYDLAQIRYKHLHLVLLGIVSLVKMGSGRAVLFIHVYVKLHLHVSMKLSCSEPVLQGTINLCGAYSLPVSVAVSQGCGDDSLPRTCGYPHTFVVLFRLRSLVWRGSRCSLIVEVRRVCIFLLGLLCLP